MARRDMADLKRRDAGEYVPTPDDLKWARTMVAIIKDGGTLAYPFNGAVYRLDHKAKTLTAAAPDSEAAKTRAVFAAIGYKVLS